MGSELRRQLREALGPDIKGLQRAVALEIADDARWDDEWNYDAVKGRRSKARLADLVRWTAAKDELSVREMLRRLSVAGWEFRLPIGKGKDGRPLYAVPGYAMQFRVPDFDVPAIVETFSNEGVATAAPSEREGPTVVGEGPTVVGEGPTVVGPPSLVSPCSSPKDSPSSSSSLAEVSGEVLEGVVIEGGGGGGDLDSSQEQDKPIARAETFVDSLDFRGKPPGNKRRTTLQLRVIAAFKAGWTENGLRRYLDISDDPTVRSAAAVYEHRLAEDELPESPAPVAATPSLPPACAQCFEKYREAVQTNLRLRMRDGQPCPDCHPSVVGMVVQDSSDGGMWDRAMHRAQQAIDTGRRLQAEHDAMSAPGGHKPYSNSGWDAMEQQVANGMRPEGADRVAHCGDPDCDEYSRTRETEDASGLRSLSACGKCHPRLQF